MRATVSFEIKTITLAKTELKQNHNSMYVEAKIVVKQMKAPFVSTRCGKVFGNGRKCELLIGIDHKCSEGHSTYDFDSFKKVTPFIFFLDADLLECLQHRAYVRPQAMAKMLNATDLEVTNLPAGMQYEIAKSMIGSIYVGRFHLKQGFMTLIEFLE